MKTNNVIGARTSCPRVSKQVEVAMDRPLQVGRGVLTAPRRAEDTPGAACYSHNVSGLSL